MADKQESLEQRAQRAILQESFFRVESAIIIALTLLSAVLLPSFVDMIQWWMPVLFGLITEGILVYSSLTDPEFGGKVVEKLLQTEFRPEKLSNKRLQQQMNQALDYRHRIDRAIREQGNSMIKDEFSQTAGQIDEWLENIYDLARRIDRYQQERDVLLRDRKQAEQRMDALRAKLAHEQATAVRDQLELSITSTQRQLDTLNKLDDTIERAQLQLDNSLTHLGTVYSQTMLVDAKDIDSGRARRLRQEIADEVVELNDILVAMDEVYLAEGATN